MPRNDEQRLAISDELYDAAVARMQVALEGSGVALVTEALEGLSLAAFVCAKDGRVQSLTSQAEELVCGDRGLVLEHRSLHAVRNDEDKTLSAAMERMAGGPASLQTVIVRGTSVSSTPLVLDVMPMPISLPPLGFTSEPRVVVVARGARGIHARKAALLQAAYEFTPAETDIALLLAQAKSAEAIAQERNVAVGTVRAQIKSVLAKLGVSRQVELVLKLSEL